MIHVLFFSKNILFTSGYVLGLRTPYYSEGRLYVR